METQGTKGDPLRELLRKGTVETTTPSRTRRVLTLVGVIFFMIVAFAIIGSLLLGGLGNAFVQLFYFFLYTLSGKYLGS